jgi:hypothetical protein
MALPVLQEFKDYGYFSVRVDRFFNVINIYGRHHDALKRVYQTIPPRAVTAEPLRDEKIDERIRRFCVIAIGSLNYMGTTNIFSDGDDPAIGQIPEDMSSFGFYVCFCYQWNLFESCIKTLVRRAIDAGALTPEVSRKLRAKWYKTKQFLDYLESGEVFGHSPFVTILPVPGWVPKTEECTYSDLDKIRELRNDLVHGAVPQEVAEASEMTRERLYERSMWILRQFASNIQQDIAQMLGTTNGQTS